MTLGSAALKVRNSAEVLIQTDNSTQNRAIKLTSSDSLGSLESIYVHFNPIELENLKRNYLQNICPEKTVYIPPVSHFEAQIGKLWPSLVIYI